MRGFDDILLVDINFEWDWASFDLNNFEPSLCPQVS